MDLTQISLFSATPEQIQVHRKRTFQEWGRGLALEEYIKRDEAFDRMPHATGGKFVVWILSRREDPSNLDFFCSCETYQREAAVSSNVSEGKPAVAYGIASVYTPPEHRNRGFAKHMMRLLHYVLADQRQGPIHIPPFPVEKWGSPPAIPPGFGMGIASALYSDVGSLFYRSCGIGLREDNGWVVDAPISTIWPVPAQQDTRDSEVEWLTEETEKEVWERDAGLIRNETQQSDHTCFSFLPDKGVAQSQKARSLFFTPQSDTGAVWGVRVGGKGSEADTRQLSFATWCLDPGREGRQTLVITRLRSTPAEFPIILSAAFQAARHFRLEQVEIWNLDANLHDAGLLLGGVTGERDDHLPSLAWYGSKGEKGDAPTVEWRYNEKFCWC